MGSIFQSTPENYDYNSATPNEITLLAGIANNYTDGLDLNFCQQIKSCGFNTVGAIVGQSKIDESLQNCFNAGIKLFLRNGSLLSYTSSFVKLYKDNEGLGGWLLDFNLTAENNKNNSEIHTAYQNIFATYGQGEENKVPPVYICLSGDWNYDGNKAKIESYPQYIADFEELFKPSFFPFSYFPDLYQNGKNPNDTESRQVEFYKDLQYFSYISRYTGVPFWSYCRCQAHTGFTLNGTQLVAPAPTWNSIRGTVFSALAYGAQGIYYWNYKQNSNTGYSNGPISPNGSKTNTWDMVSTVNREVRAFNKIFCGCEFLECRHLKGNVELLGIKELTDKTLIGPMDRMPEVLTGNKYDILFSHIWNNKEEYLVIVCSPFINNKSLGLSVSENNRLQLHFSKYWKLEQLTASPSSGYLTSELTDYNPVYNLAPGDYLIFRWS